MKLRFFASVFSAGALFLSACSTVNTRIHTNQAAFDGIPPAQQQLIRQGNIELDFTKSMVSMALGEPDRVSVRADHGGVTEIWSYYKFKNNTSYFDQSPFIMPYYARGVYPTYHFYSSPFSRSFSSRETTMRVSFKDGKVVSYESSRN